ncbi:hypothetical protein QZH41_015091, partial [Actinostola sp. cb2023]
MTTAMSKHRLKNTTARRKHCPNYGLCFCTFVAAILWAFVIYEIRCTLIAPEFMEVLRRIVFVGWFLLCACQQLICLLTTSSPRKARPLTRFDKFVKAVALVRAENISQTQKSVKTIVIVGWAAIAMNIIIVMTAFYAPNDAVRRSSREIFFGNSNWTNQVSYIFTSGVHILVNGNWIFPMCFYVTLCQVVAGRFDEIFARAASAISKKKSLNLASLRREYAQLCHVVSALDDILSPLGVFTFAIYIPLVCLNINVCIHTFEHDSIINRIAYTCWISCNITILLICTIAAARVNNSVYRLSEVLYDININYLDSKSELELMLLLSNINSNYTGLTVGGLVTITKGMILT